MEGISPPSTPLGDVLKVRRRRTYVGREGERELVRARLESADQQLSVLYLHGPGGIGKTALLDVLAEIAADAGATVVRLDGRDLPPSPTAVLDVLGETVEVPVTGAIARGEERLCVLVDTYEVLAPIDDWVRTRLLPRLPATALTVIASRTPPSPQWRADAGWCDLLRVVSMRNLTPRQCRQYLREVAVPPQVHERICQITHGHPLALSLVADVASRGGEVAADPLTPDLIGVLMQRFIDVVPSPVHRRALEVCALARVTTESLLRDVLELDDAHEVFAWLRHLSFVDAGPEGLFPHDLSRDVVDADLRWRDLDSYTTVFHRVWRHLRRRLTLCSGREQQRVIFDLKFVFRNLPGVLSPVDWGSWGHHYPEPAREEDRETIVGMVRSHEGAESAEICAAWFVRQPEGFFIVRRPDGGARGFFGLLDLSRASSDDLAADPGAAAAWNFARAHAPPRSGEAITLTRFVVDGSTYQDPSPTLNAIPIITMQRYLCTPLLSWDFLTLAEPDRWNEYFAVADLPRAEGADFEVGARRYGLFAHDFRRVPVDAWFEQVAVRALSENPTAPALPAAHVLVLSQPEFEQAVRQALHDWHRPDLLRRNPLMRTRLVCDRVGAEPDVAELDSVLRDAVDALAGDPRDDKLVRAVDRTYLRPAATQEAAAEMLGLPFSTYRRHLTQGVAQIVSWLWDREIYGPRSEQK
ncbi:ATP-binding protein [Rhodococcus sp. WAY2]|uniref:ATP-binding protein n=1 Tax=Rhodococcus sp. WAY2 TaxID=2663121 RepID=UPI00132030BB|nr:ATP-binding protein [Rhodococcus sp. WAY2]QHE72753.1 ATPase related to the helicase subunit of the Holliday junction resolvase [Rhodococcus sp. WAY2]